MIYLDNCATTMPLPSVVEAMKQALEEDFFNPSSLHKRAVETEKRKEGIRREIKQFLHCSGELYFTSGATESNNMAIMSAIAYKDCKGNVVTTNIEHPSVSNVLKFYGAEIREVSVNKRGQVEFTDLISAIDEDTALVSLFHVNNELGSVNPVEIWVPEIKRQYPKVKVHIDGVQAVGKIPVDFDGIGCDSYSFSGHKFHGPKGIGGLLVAKHINPMIYGGGQEMGMRSGTENIPGIYGLSAAFKALSDEGMQLDKAKARFNYLKDALESIPDIRINTTAPASPYILNVSIEDTRGEVLLHMLEEKDIFISTSSACSSHRTGKNPVISALGLKASLAEGTIRICMSRYTDLDELDQFVEALKEVVNQVRSIMRR